MLRWHHMRHRMPHMMLQQPRMKLESGVGLQDGFRMRLQPPRKLNRGRGRAVEDAAAGAGCCGILLGRIGCRSKRT